MSRVVQGRDRDKATNQRLSDDCDAPRENSYQYRDPLRAELQGRFSLITVMSNTPSFDRFALPGFTLPLNFKPQGPENRWDLEPIGEGRDLFPNALDTTDLDGGLRMTPLREFTMLRMMNQLTDKPDWHIKVFDDTIASKWKAEALEDKEQDVTQSMVDWVIDELRYKAEIFKKTGTVSVFDADVVKSDTAIPAELKQALRDAVRVLENVPDRLKDWHPGSDGQVLDLVHPSLFPLVYGRSRVLENKTVGLDDFVRRTGEGRIIAVPPEEEAGYKDISLWRRETRTKPFSRQFQWLPCDVELADNHKDVKITSYINNLHPFDHKKLYSVLEQIIARTIPLWNQTLTPMAPLYNGLERIPYYVVKYNPDPEYGPEEDGPQREEGEDQYKYWSRRYQWYEETQKLVLPEPGTFAPPSIPEVVHDTDSEEDEQHKSGHDVDIFRDYKHRGIQVIVKLANIHLTPEKPEYAGGTWHVEGQLNEHICASAIYYYDSENVTTSRLAFRQLVAGGHRRDIDYRQNNEEWLEEVFGCPSSGPCIQAMGSIVTSEDRLLTWPNVLQHQVQPFKLAEPSKPGHRKILALFLVDPHILVISTANVACQRKDWWTAHIKELTDAVSNLPLELQDYIYEDVDFPFSWDEAKELRTKLMDERRIYVDEMDREFHDIEFNLCEH